MEKNTQQIIIPTLLEIGFRISVPLIAFILIGKWLDEKFSISPLFLFLGIFFSLFTSVYGIIQTFKRVSK